MIGVAGLVDRRAVGLLRHAIDELFPARAEANGNDLVAVRGFRLFQADAIPVAVIVADTLPNEL